MKFSCTTIDGLSARDRCAMRELLARHFSGVDAASFEADLTTKSHALRLFSDDGQLAGFSSFDYRLTINDGAPLAVIYSGDTIVDPSGWSASSLGAAWVATVLELHDKFRGGAPLWWLLLTSGVRTNRYLSVYLHRYHPAPVGRDDPEAGHLLAWLAKQRFGERFDPSTGVVRLANPQCLLSHLAEIPAHLMDDEQVQLFLAANPNHRAGDELASLCRLDENNLNRAGMRALAIGRRLLAETLT